MMTINVRSKIGFLGNLYQMYDKDENLIVNESYPSNGVDLKKHSFLIRNIQNGKFLFASLMEPEGFVKKIYDRDMKKGYNYRYSIGSAKGKNEPFMQFFVKLRRGY